MVRIFSFLPPPPPPMFNPHLNGVTSGLSFRNYNTAAAYDCWSTIIQQLEKRPERNNEHITNLHLTTSYCQCLEQGFPTFFEWRHT
jgi:hypothetical protein